MKNETIDQFVTRLRQKSANCEFTDKDAEIKSQMIQGCVITKTANKMFRGRQNFDRPFKYGKNYGSCPKRSKTYGK